MTELEKERAEFLEVHKRSVLYSGESALEERWLGWLSKATRVRTVTPSDLTDDEISNLVVDWMSRPRGTYQDLVRDAIKQLREKGAKQ